MSSTAMRVVSIKLPPSLDQWLSEIARARRTSRSAVVRAALEAAAAPKGRSAAALAGDLMGCVDRPRDLSTNPKYMRGYGR